MRHLINAFDRRFSDENHAFFVVLGHARTGTNLLCSLLNSHPDITCAYEVLHPDDAGLRQKFHRDMVEPTDHWLQLQPGAERESAINYIESRLLPIAASGNPFGPKILYWQVHKLDVFNYLARSNFSFLHVSRNPVEVYVSQLQAERTGQWFLGRDDPPPRAAEPLEIDLPDLTAFCTVYRKQFNRFNRIGRRLCNVEYSVLCEKPQQEMDRVFRFLGVSPAAAVSYSRKQQSWDIRERISNFDELIQSATGEVHSLLEILSK